MGFLPLPHSQNEDIQVSADGTRAIIAADGGLLVPVLATRGLHIVDTSDPSSPEVVAWLDNSGGGTKEPLHTFRPVNGDWFDGNPGANGLGCSGHWFDIRDGDTLIATSWYEHGVKVIEVLPDYSMQEVGFFQPVVGAAGAASWVVADEGTEYIYSTDYERGLDILRFDRDAPRPTEGERRAAALAVRQPNPVANAERWFCELGAQG